MSSPYFALPTELLGIGVFLTDHEDSSRPQIYGLDLDIVRQFRRNVLQKGLLRRILTTKATYFRTRSLICLSDVRDVFQMFQYKS